MKQNLRFLFIYGLGGGAGLIFDRGMGCLA